MESEADWLHTTDHIARLRASHTARAPSTSCTWDVAAGLPIVLQDGSNTYLYGLDLISVTDGSGNVTATYAYDVFGAIRSQSGSSANEWLFTGEQRDP